MRATFYGFEIAKSALNAARSALDVASHNIANADTVGYTRQRLVTASVPASTANTFIRVDNKTSSGRGVAGLFVEQIRDPYLDKQYRALSSSLGSSTVKSNEFSKIESLLNTELEDSETTSALSGVFGDFYRSIYRLTEDSSSMEIRQTMLESSIAMTETFNYQYKTLVDQQEILDQTVQTTVDFINETTQQIADLNEKIYGGELTGEHANDLRDKRNVLLDQLSSKVDIDYAETSDNKFIVTLGGHTLIDHTEAHKLSAVATKDNDSVVPGSGFLYEVYWQDSGEQADVSALSSLSGISDVNFVQTSGAAQGAAATLPLGYAAGSFTLGALTSTSAGFTEGSFADGGSYRVVLSDGAGKQQVLEFTVAKGSFADQDALGAALNGQNIGLEAGFPGDKAQISSGELKGYLDMRDGNTLTNKGIPKVLEEIDSLVRKIVSDFNEQHQQGYTLHEWDTVNNVSGSINGVKFFEDYGDISKVNAGNFAVRQSIQDDIYSIAASDAPVNQSGGVNNQKGNSVNALALSQLITGTNGKGNFDGAYKSLVVGVGTEMSKIINNNTSDSVRLAQIQKQRESTSGVSIDEEMTDVLKFGHSYNAASRLITTMDEQLDNIINKMGLVGR